MKYKVIEAVGKKQLEEKVEAYIGYGWKPQGSVTIAMLPQPNLTLAATYAQAMTKESAEIVFSIRGGMVGANV